MASIHEATGDACVVAFHAGNLMNVSKNIRAVYRDAEIIICADDDHTNPGNPGLEKAREAAISIGGFFAVPEFGDTRVNDYTDFNDLYLARGIEFVRACVEQNRINPGVIEKEKTDLCQQNRMAAGSLTPNQFFPLTGPQIPFPVEFLPPLMRDAVRETFLEYTKVPTALACSTVLG